MILVVVAVAAFGDDAARPKLCVDRMVLTHHGAEAAIVAEPDALEVSNNVLEKA